MIPPCLSTPVLSLITLCLPDPLDCLSHADIIGLELVKANAHNNRGQVESPTKQLAGLRNTLRRQIVDDHRSESQPLIREEVVELTENQCECGQSDRLREGHRSWGLANHRRTGQ